MDNIYSIKDLTKKYDNNVVVDIPSLDITHGTCIGLVGNNGAGKTTLLRLILDLIQPTTGSVEFDGQNVANFEDWKSYTGAYLDENMIINYLTPNEYFETLRKIYGMSTIDLQEHLAMFTEFFNGELAGKGKYIRDLSKGNFKKTGIAAALMNFPQAVLLDEPFENLDPTSQGRLKHLITKLKTERNITFIISSHNLSHILDLSDRILLLEKGRIKLDIHDKSSMAAVIDEYFKS
jgi:ABC-2 type transport system ATP-binding protein